jgi:hypothetical protein
MAGLSILDRFLMKTASSVLEMAAALSREDAFQVGRVFFAERALLRRD